MRIHIDDGRSFWEHAEEAGYEPARWRESLSILDDLTGWSAVTVPHNWNATDTTDNRPSVGWYRKDFELPSASRARSRAPGAARSTHGCSTTRVPPV